MSAIPKRRLTEQEYLAIERKASYRSEFFNGEMFAMAGTTRAHNRIKDNLVGELYSRFKGKDCQEFSSDMRVKIPSTGLYTYPDVLVTCGELEFQDDEQDILLNPRIIIEVLSPSTESYDRGKKFDHYRTIASLEEYILIEQDRPSCERRVRQSNGSWLITYFENLDGFFELASIPAKIPMKDIFAGVQLRDPNSPEEYPEESGIFQSTPK
jgi:Uma2 family endonuclease